MRVKNFRPAPADVRVRVTSNMDRRQFMLSHICTSYKGNILITKQYTYNFHLNIVPLMSSAFQAT